MRRALSICLTGTAALAAAVFPAPAAANREPKEPKQHTDFDRRNFTRPVVIDNRFLPLVPGTQFIFEGQLRVPEGVIPHRVVFTVTDVTKMIDGVRTLVIWDRDFNYDELQEEELAFEAQDDDGTVWNLGEYPEETEDGEFLGAPNTWLSGRAGAKAGIAMQSEPKVGTPHYLQGFAPAIDFQDNARVDQVHQKTCVPAGCFGDVLVIDEWNPLEQPEDGHQFKYHAPGVGIVRIDSKSGDVQEQLTLRQLRRLRPDELAKARRRTLELDRRAYDFAKDVYRGTPPAEAIGRS
jgi:hypothetical protein